MTMATLGLENAAIELQAYWINGFGNATRIDYGSGHELSFIAFLCCLDIIGFWKESDYAGVVLGVFNR
jgi:serine/threonine-protein phosphatase 2A activator